MGPSGIQYATEEEQRNSSRKNEGAGQKQKQQPVVGVSERWGLGSLPAFVLHEILGKQIEHGSPSEDEGRGTPQQGKGRHMVGQQKE